jgi:hypothetical protein
MSTDTVVLDKLAYSIPNFAKAVDLSIEAVRQHIREGNLVPSYSKSKPLIMREEGERWLRSLPAERPGATA